MLRSLSAARYAASVKREQTHRSRAEHAVTDAEPGMPLTAPEACCDQGMPPSSALHDLLGLVEAKSRAPFWFMLVVAALFIGGGIKAILRGRRLRRDHSFDELAKMFPTALGSDSMDRHPMSQIVQGVVAVAIGTGVLVLAIVVHT